MKILFGTLLILRLLSPSRLDAQQDIVQVTADNVRLRLFASIEAGIVATLSKGTRLTVLGREGAWIQVSYGDKKGFVRSNLVASATGSLSPLPVVPAAAPPAERPKTAPVPVSVAPPSEPARATPSAVQQGDRPSAKEPGTATLISVLVTGGGQFYAGDTKRGLMMFGGSVGSLVAGAALSGCGGYSCNLTPLYIGSLAAVGIWVYSIVDAAPTARRMNAKYGYKVSGLSPIINVGPGRTTQIGLQLRF